MKIHILTKRKRGDTKNVTINHYIQIELPHGKKGREMNETKFESYYNYMQSVIPRLVEAERIVDEIKGSPQWKRSSNYFKVLYKRGILAENPTKKNGYKIEKGKNIIKISDIEDLLTSEQLETIKSRIL